MVSTKILYGRPGWQHIGDFWRKAAIFIGTVNYPAAYYRQDRLQFFDLVIRHRKIIITQQYEVCEVTRRDASFVTFLVLEPAGTGGMKLDQAAEIAHNLRLTSILTDTAGKRYADLIERYPTFADRFPQHIIASYLGINKDTLSRVKRKLKLK